MGIRTQALLIASPAFYRWATVRHDNNSNNTQKFYGAKLLR